jgi:hypothetical protein
MKGARRRQQGQGTLELIEEAVHLVRTASYGTLAFYYLGALPFVLGFLYFWMDMAQSAFATERLAGSALAVAILFLWMKFWQAIFAENLMASLACEKNPPLTLARCRRILSTQVALQGTGLFILPVALVLTFPFAWVFAFYQNLTVLAGSEVVTLRDIVAKSRRQTMLWPKQNHGLLAMLAAFGFFVCLNWSTVAFLAPDLAKRFLGIESVFSRSPESLLNSTFFAAMLGLTYLSLDPIVKAAYTLRCFYGQSLGTGEDLKARLKTSMPASSQWALCSILTLILLSSTALASSGSSASPSKPPGDLPISVPIEGESSAGSAPAEPKGSSISPDELDRAIQQVIRQDKYAWREPREKAAHEDDKEQGVIGRFVGRVWEMVRDGLKIAFEWLDRLLRKVFGGRTITASGPSGVDWALALRLLLCLLIAVVAAAIVLLFYRFWTRRYRRAETVESEAIQPVPDLTDENIGADHLPEDGWVKLARELWERGELRLALRAFYLASLAHLAACNLISLAKFKSNRDYETELGRRGHSFPELCALFGENVSVFDRIWYGLHDIDGALLSRFAANVERMKGGTL